MIRASVFDVKHYAINDGPGIRTTFFFQGCSLSCDWCQNPESQSVAPQIVVNEKHCIGCGVCRSNCPAIDESGKRIHARCVRCYRCVKNCPTGALQLCGREATLEELLRIVEQGMPFYEASSGGITCSGGECLLQAEFLEAFLAECGKRGVHTTVDTCGAVPFEAFERTMPYTDLYLYDIKLMEEARHIRYTGASNKTILENLARLYALGEKVVVRVPLIPGITDTRENLSAIGGWLKTNAGDCDVELLQYNSLAESKYAKPPFFDDEAPVAYKLPGVKTQSAEELDAMEAVLRNQGHRVKSLRMNAAKK
jgi:pyruvate formate lyase activating enzyme